MHKPLKITVAVLLPLIGLAVLAVVLAWVYVDTLAEQGVERGATYALDVSTELGSADVGVLSGRVELSGLSVDNPEGFEADHFLTLENADAGVTLGSLMEDVVEVPGITLTGIDLHLERTTSGANYKVIMDNLARFENGEQKDPDPDAKKFVVRTLTLRDVTVHANIVPIGGAIGDLTTAEVTVDQVVLRDLGSGGEPMTIAEITTVVVKAVLASAIEVGGGVIPEDVLGDIGDQLAALLDLEDMGVGSIEGLGEAAADLLGAPVEEIIEGAGGAIEEAGEAIQKEADRAKERLGGLLPGQKKEEDEPKPEDPG
ncbi:MAG: AsmA family protein [Phycisphaerales bacterium JB060]